MKGFSFVTLFLVFNSFLVYSQSNDVSYERAQSLSSMADFYYTASNYDKAIDLQRKSMDIMDQLFGKNSYNYASSAMAIAKYYYSKGNDLFSNIDSLDAKQCFSNAYTNLKIVEKVTRDSMLIQFRNMDHKERYVLWQQISPLYQRLLPCYIEKNQNDTTLSDLYNYVLISKGITWRNIDEVLKGDWRIVQKNLGSDEIAIEFISPLMLDDESIVLYALLIRRNDSSPKMIKLFDLNEFEDNLKSASSKLDRDLRIGRLIWGALEKELKSIKNIYFSASFVLNTIRVEYLPVNGTDYYGDKYNFYRLSSTMELTKRKIKSQYKNAVIYGGLDYDSNKENIGNNEGKRDRAGLEKLFNTDVEIKEVAQLLKTNGVNCKKYTDSLGTESSFRNLSRHKIDILHLSTHSKFDLYEEMSSRYIDEDKGLSSSYLALSGANKILTDTQINRDNDGVITALDISKMNFKGLDLVCLSSCQSGLGSMSDDDGILGLQMGFKIAGVNTILMSVHKVDDEATKILMVEFYKNLMSGKTKLQSLKDAQKHLRQVENGKYDKPEYWASFIMLDGLN